MIVQDREYNDHQIIITKNDFGYFDVQIKELESNGAPVIAEYNRISCESHALFVGFAFVDGIGYQKRCQSLERELGELGELGEMIKQNKRVELDVNFKTIEEYREEFTDIIKTSVDAFMRKTTECKEEILLAFIAKYECHPDEITACQMTKPNGVTEFWIEKRNQQLKQKLNFMLENQIGLEEEHGHLFDWNKGYKEAIEDIIHFMEHGEDD
jgi:hypothetical protein